MPRRPKNPQPDDLPPGENAGQNLEEALDNPQAEYLEDDPEAEPGPPANLMAPRAERIAREEALAAKGELPWLKILIKRITPDKVRHPQTGMSVPCSNQATKIEGQFTEADVELKARDYFGGGTVVATAHDPANANKFVWRRTYDFPGEPNIANVLADCMTQDLAMSMGIPPGGIPGAPGAPGGPMVPGPNVPLDPVRAIEQEARVLDAEAKKMEVAAEAESRKAKAQRRMREIERQGKREEQLEEFGVVDGGEGFGFEPPPGRGGPLAPYRRGPFGRGPFMPPEPLDEMDRPMSVKDIMIREQMSDLKAQNARLEAKLEHAIEKLSESNSKPKSDLPGLVVAITAALAPVISKVIDNTAQAAAAQRQSSDMLVKTMFESSNKNDKQMELLMQAMGLKDQRDSKSIEQFTELIRLGRDMADGGGEPESVITQIGKAGGDLLGGLVSAFQAAKAPPPPQHPQVMIPQRVPMPGQSAGALPPRPPQPQLPVLPQAPAAQTAPPPPPPPPAAAVNPAPAAANPNEEPDMTDAEMEKLANTILDQAVAESAAKPENPAWVEIAFKGMPGEWAEAVAQADSYTDLIELVKPFVPITKIISLWPRLQADPAIRPWLERGFVQLQKLCQAELAKEAAANPDAEPVAEESFGGEDME